MAWVLRGPGDPGKAGALRAAKRNRKEESSFSEEKE
jgi:hypothetical protein